MQNTLTFNRAGRYPRELYFAVVDYGNYRTIEAMDVEDRHHYDTVATSCARTRRKNPLQPNEGCFVAQIDSYGWSSLVDEMIQVGFVSVTGRFDDWYAEIKPNEAWFNELPLMSTWEEDEWPDEDNVIQIKYDYVYSAFKPVARIKRGNWLWSINKFTDGYEIHAHNTVDSDKGFHTNWNKPLLDTWLQAMRLERATDEFVDEGKRIAEKHGVSFIHKLVCSVAAKYWYLEG